MSTTKPSIDLPRSLPYKDAPYVYDLVDLTNLVIRDSIWARRKQARMSETKLANALNKDRSFMRRIDDGRHTVTIAEFKSLAEALGLDHLTFAEEVLSEIVIASKSIMAIAEPGVSLFEPSAQVDTQSEDDVKEDTQEDEQEGGGQKDEQDCTQENAKKDEKGTYRKTFRSRRKMSRKEKSTEDTQDSQANAKGADPEGPAPDE